MAHTFESVVAHFGEDAQVVGGAIVVNIDGKNREVGRTRLSDGVFFVTEEGLELLDAGEHSKQTQTRRPRQQAASE